MYDTESVLGHEILREILLSLLRQLDLVRFELDLSNAHFLEDHWRRPLLRSAMVNPRIELGLHLRSVVAHGFTLLT